MLQLVDISKAYSARHLFDGASLVLNAGERLALFGRNGSGKSTLLRMLAGDEHPDSGEIKMPRHYRVGFLRQHLDFKGSSIVEEVCHGIAPEHHYKAGMILTGLGFSNDDLSRAPAHFSGGFQLRVALAKLMISAPSLMLLDEPTNYLDIVALRWLTRYLTRWDGELIVISHDRGFCDAVSTHSALIHRGKIKKLAGPAEKVYLQIAEEEELYERTRQNQLRERDRLEQFVTRFRAKASKATLVQSRVKALERMQIGDELSSESTLEFGFPYADFPGRFPLEFKDLRFGFGERTLIDGLSLTVGKNDKIGIIGSNGRGKSTLLRLVGGELEPRSGSVSVSPSTRMSYFGQTNVDRLHAQSTVVDEIRSVNPNLSNTALRTICGVMLFEDKDALKKISVLSGGERCRVLLGKILAQPSNLLLLDEPTSHLDVESVESLTQAIEDFEGAVLLVTHSEELLRRTATRLVVFEPSGPFVFEGDYDRFLATRGWVEEEDEDDPAAVRSGTGEPGLTKRESRQQRAMAQQERARVLTPLKRKVEKLEKEISTLEETCARLEREIAEASLQQKGARISELARELTDKKKRLEACMSEWETAAAAHDTAERSFDAA